MEVQICDTILLIDSSKRDKTKYPTPDSYIIDLEQSIPNVIRVNILDNTPNIIDNHLLEIFKPNDSINTKLCAKYKDTCNKDISEYYFQSVNELNRLFINIKKKSYQATNVILEDHIILVNVKHYLNASMVRD